MSLCKEKKNLVCLFDVCFVFFIDYVVIMFSCYEKTVLIKAKDFGLCRLAFFKKNPNIKRTKIKNVTQKVTR